MNAESDDPKQQAILHAAWEGFARYGLRKTSMDDIARAAGMSRPALYLHFRNKEDIYRSLVQTYYAKAAVDVAQALADAPGPVADRLAAAFAAQGGAILETMLASPHGREILDVGKAAAADIVATGEARLTGIYADWLQSEAAAGRVALTGPALSVADAITVALKGLKAGTTDYREYVARRDQFARLFGAALEPR